MTDDTLIVTYNTDIRDHDRTPRQVMQICHQEILKLNKNICYFRCTKKPFFGEVISREGKQLDPKKLCMLTEMPLPKNKKNYNHF